MGGSTLIDMTGKRFGRMRVLERVGSDPSRQALWLCVCDCGTERVVRGDGLRSGHSKSCGCLHKEATILAHTKHGHAKRTTSSPTYASWRKMRDRCLNREHKHWQHYGGRGVTICDRWLGEDGFSNFIQDMGERPNGMSLDRIDNDGNYEPGNCRWATQKQQLRNKRSNRILSHGGQALTVSEWAEKTGIRFKTISSRLDRGWTVEDALTRPVLTHKEAA